MTCSLRWLHLRKGAVYPGNVLNGFLNKEYKWASFLYGRGALFF